MELTTMYESLGVSRAVYEYGEKILAELKPRFEALDQTAEYNQTKVCLLYTSPSPRDCS